MAICKKCETEKQKEDFYFHRHTGNFDKTCKDCRKSYYSAYMKNRMQNDPEFRERQFRIASKHTAKSNRTGTARIKKLNDLNDKYYNGEKITKQDVDSIVENGVNCFSCGRTQDEYIDFRDRVLNYAGSDKSVSAFSGIVFKTSKHKSVDEFVFAQLDASLPNVKDNLVRVCYPCKMIAGSGIGIDLKKYFTKKLLDHIDKLV